MMHGSLHAIGTRAFPSLCILCSLAGIDETGGDDDPRPGDDRRGDAGGGGLPRGARSRQKNRHLVQPDDPTALEAGLCLSLLPFPSLPCGQPEHHIDTITAQHRRQVTPGWC